MSLLFGLFALEMAAGVRHLAQSRVTAWMLVHHGYEQRHHWQSLLIALTCGLVLLSAIVLVVKARHANRNLLVALLSCVVLCGSFIVETISLHAVDAYVYSPAGPLLLIGWWWIGASAVIMVCALKC